MMMKKILSALLLFSVLIAGCVKSDTKCPYTYSGTVASATEIDSLTNLLADSGIIATRHPSGFFYKISSSGTGTGITNLCSNIAVSYKGSLFNGQVFDSTVAGHTAAFQLCQVIVAWQKGIPLVSEGGDITLYIHPSLGYGSNAVKDSQGNIIIPANSYLKFDVHIVDIQ